MTATNGRVQPDVLDTIDPPLRALSLSDLAAFTFPKVDEVVDGLIPSGALVLAVGRPKAGKSLIMGIDLCASVALGESFLDRATMQGPALYVPAEDALRLVRDRFWTRIGNERAAPLFVVPADGSIDQSVRLDQPESFMHLAAMVERIRPRVMVLDPLRELHHRKENDSDEMAAVLRPLRQLAHDTDTSIVLIHHRNKHATDPSLASRGSSAIVGGVDVVVTLDLAGEDDDSELTPDKLITMRVEGRYGPRQRLGARLGTGLRWHPADPRIDTEIPARSRVLTHLQVTQEGMTGQELADELRVPLKTVQNVVSVLSKSDDVQRTGAGTKTDPFRYQAGTVREPAGKHISASDQRKLAMVPGATGYTPSTGGTITATDDEHCKRCGAPLYQSQPGGMCQTCTERSAA